MTGIAINNLRLGYGKRTLLKHASATFPAEELTALIGRNGTGKSTLLKAIAGLKKTDEGAILVEGENIATMTPLQIAQKIAFVSTERVHVAHLKVKDVVALGRAPYTNWIGRLDAEDEQIIARSLAQVGLTAFADKEMDTLSDGESQRAMIARALAQDTPVMLLDEPTAFLDLPNRYEICLLLRRLAHENKKCIFFSSHDLGIVLEMCDKLALIDSGKLHHDTPHRLFEQGVLQHLFDGTALEFADKEGHIRFHK